MKQYRLRLLTGFMIFTMLILAPVQAQSPGYIVAEIPFPFTAGNTTLPAGHYVIKPQSASLLAIQTPDGQVRAVVLARSIRGLAPEDQGRLIFNRYHNRYFLSQVWASGDTVGRQLYKSDIERELGRRKPRYQMATRTVWLT